MNTYKTYAIFKSFYVGRNCETLMFRHDGETATVSEFEKLDRFGTIYTPCDQSKFSHNLNNLNKYEQFLLVDQLTVCQSSEIEFATAFMYNHKPGYADLFVDIVDKLTDKLVILDEPITVILDVFGQVKFKIVTNGRQYTTQPFDIMSASNKNEFSGINNLVVRYVVSEIINFINQ